MRSEVASTLTFNESTRFVWMIGCVLQDACDNMPGILISNSNIKSSSAVATIKSSKPTGLICTDAELEVEQRWR